MIKLLATDLDRTLIPNGEESYDNSMDIFRGRINKNKLKLIYVTGRSLNLIKKAIKEFDLAVPDYAIGDVGANIFVFNRTLENIEKDKGWHDYLKKNTPGWDVKKFREEIQKKKIKGVELQEESKQAKYKLSYYIELKNKESVLKKIRETIEKICSDAEIVFSEDYPDKRGLLDILPKSATKKGALDYLIKKMKFNKSEVLFCGDSGNDYSLLASEYKAVIVRNASKEIKDKVQKTRKEKGTLNDLYIAVNQEKQGLNGNYVSGIIQGLEYFGAG